jgi:hypothetical protein
LKIALTSAAENGHFTEIDTGDGAEDCAGRHHAGQGSQHRPGLFMSHDRRYDDKEIDDHRGSLIEMLPVRPEEDHHAGDHHRGSADPHEAAGQTREKSYKNEPDVIHRRILDDPGRADKNEGRIKKAEASLRSPGLVGRPLRAAEGSEAGVGCDERARPRTRTESPPVTPLHSDGLIPVFT